MTGLTVFELTEIEFCNRLPEFFDVMMAWKSRIAFEIKVFTL